MRSPKQVPKLDDKNLQAFLQLMRDDLGQISSQPIQIDTQTLTVSPNIDTTVGLIDKKVIGLIPISYSEAFSGVSIRQTQQGSCIFKASFSNPQQMTFLIIYR